MIRVVIADDHHLVRQGIRALLENAGGFEVLGEATDGNEAVELTERLRPQVLVLDLTMPLMNGIEALRKVRALGLDTRVLMLSMHSDEALVRRALSEGATGFLLKASVVEELLTAVRAAERGELFLGPGIPREFLEPGTPTHGAGHPQPLDPLTPRQREVLQLIVEGKKNAEIAKQLGISIKTVEKHRAALMIKLNVRDLPALVRFAVKHGMIPADA